MRSRNIEHLTALQQARARQEEAAREREAAPWWLHELGSSIWTGLRRGLNNIDIQQADAAQKSLDAMEATEGKARELRQQGTPDLLGQNIGADPFELTSAAGTWNPDELYRKKHTALERARDRNLAEYEEDLPALVPTRAAQTQREMEAYYGKKGAAESLAYIITHPRMATNMAAESLGQFAPTLLATGVATAASGPLAGAAVIGAGSAQMEHGSTLAERIDASAAQTNKSRASVLADQQLMNDIRHEARTRAAVIGTTEALTFGLTGPAFHAVRARVPGWKGTLAAWGAGTGVQATGGAAGEAGAQLATHGEITSWPAVVAEFALEVLQGAPEIAFHAQTGTRLLRQEHAQDMANLRELGENVRESKTRQRAPEAFRDAVRDMAETGNMRDAYIDGDVLHQSDLAEQLANALPEQAQDIQEAVDHGGAVQISPADLITRILPNEELTAALEPHLRFDADGVSTDELNGTVQADLEADIARGVAEAAAKDVRQAEVDAIRDEYAAQLETTGRFTPAVNKIYGTLVASFYDVTAERLGISAREAMAMNPLKIVSEPVSGFNQEAANSVEIYSAMEREIANTPMKNGATQSWLQQIEGWIRNGKVKEEEIQWSSLREWLNEQQGKISKEDVIDYLQENLIAIKEEILSPQWEVVGTDEEPHYFDSEDEAWDFHQREREWADDAASVREDDDSLSVEDYENNEIARFDREEIEQWEDEDGNYYSREELQEEAENYDGRLEESDDTITVYDEDGDEVNRVTRGEDAVIWRNSETDETFDDIDEVRAHLEEIADSVRDEYRDRVNGPEASERGGTKYEDYTTEGHTNYREMLLTAEGLQNEYQSSHWKQHQNVIAHIRLSDFGSKENGDYTLMVEELQSDWAQERRDGKEVPDAPFVGSTGKWLNLALKKVMQQAVEGNYDRIAFVTGEQSAARYSLDRDIARVEWDGKNLRAIRKDGEGVIEREADENGLGELIGAEAAEKLKNAPATDGVQVIEGEDLKMGGEGMRGFYDNIVPKAVHELVKKLDKSVRLAPEVLPGTSETQPTLQITDKMRDALTEKGLPLYQKKGVPRGAFDPTTNTIALLEKAASPPSFTNSATSSLRATSTSPIACVRATTPPAVAHLPMPKSSC